MVMQNLQLNYENTINGEITTDLIVQLLHGHIPLILRWMLHDMDQETTIVVLHLLSMVEDGIQVIMVIYGEECEVQRILHQEMEYELLNKTVNDRVQHDIMSHLQQNGKLSMMHLLHGRIMNEQLIVVSSHVVVVSLSVSQRS